MHFKWNEKQFSYYIYYTVHCTYTKVSKVKTMKNYLTFGYESNLMGLLIFLARNLWKMF